MQAETKPGLQPMLQAYIECALWASTGENDEPLDGRQQAEESLVKLEQNFCSIAKELMRQGCNAQELATLMRMAADEVPEMRGED